MTKLKYHAVWISDVHIGTRDAKLEYLLDFLRNTEFKTLYLVGDIIDIWKMRTGWHWSSLNAQLFQLLTERARQGSSIIYIPGNHDEVFRDYCDREIYGIRLQRQAVHHGLDGRKFLITHGDEFDCIVLYNKWLAHLGSFAYNNLLKINHHYNKLRLLLGFDYWSLSAYLKFKVKSAVNFIGDFEKTLAAEARRRGLDGVICGHIHHATQTEIDGIFYANSGDWVESCSAVVERYDGQFQIIHWVKDSIKLLDAANERQKTPISLSKQHAKQDRIHEDINCH